MGQWITDEFHTKVDMLVRGSIDLPVWEKVLRADPCSYCKSASGGTLDHIDPILRGQNRQNGAKKSPSQNGTGSCYTCNNAKGKMKLLPYLLAAAEGRDRGRDWKRSLRRYFKPEHIEMLRKEGLL